MLPLPCRVEQTPKAKPSKQTAARRTRGPWSRLIAFRSSGLLLELSLHRLARAGRPGQARRSPGCSQAPQLAKARRQCPPRRARLPASAQRSASLLLPPDSYTAPGRQLPVRPALAADCRASCCYNGSHFPALLYVITSRPAAWFGVSGQPCRSLPRTWRTP